MMMDEDGVDAPESYGVSVALSQVKPSASNESNAAENSQMVFDAASIIEEIDNELQKDQQGISEESTIRNLLRKLEHSKINKKTGRGCKVDSLAFKKFSQLMVSKAALLKDDKDKCLNMKEMAMRMKEFAREQFDERDNVEQNDFNAFAIIGETLSHLLFKAPPFYFVKPCIPCAKNLLIREKKERARSQKIVSEAKVIAGKTTEQAKQASEEQNESSVTKELDNVRRHFRTACKQHGDGASIDYFRFVLHPTSFGESVENMFYVSFLIRDGHVRLNVDESTGRAIIVKLNREERETISTVDRSALDTTQFISRVDYELWERLVGRLNIQKPMIVR